MERKIRRNIFVLIGIASLLLVGMILGWFFIAVRPQKEKIAKAQSDYNDRKKIADSLKTELANQKKAEDKRRYLEAQLAFFRSRYRNFYYPKLVAAGSETQIEKARRIDTWRRFVREYFSDYGEALRQVIIDAGNSADDPSDGRQFLISTTIKVDPPPKAPEDLTIPPNGLLKPTSATNGGVLNVSVTGTFSEIETFFTNVNRSPILFVVGNLKLEGVSPYITANFTLTPYLIGTGPGIELNTGGGGGAASGGAAGGVAGGPGIPGAPGVPGAGRPTPD